MNDQTARVGTLLASSRDIRQAAGSKKVPYPDVQLGTFILLPLKDFRSGIGGAPTPSRQRLPWLVEIPKSKICEAKEEALALVWDRHAPWLLGALEPDVPQGPPPQTPATFLPASLMSMLPSSRRFSVLRSRWTM